MAALANSERSRLKDTEDNSQTCTTETQWKKKKWREGDMNMERGARGEEVGGFVWEGVSYRKGTFRVECFG